ncbi:glutathione synthetase, ATP-grasp domain [Parapedobacter composti]|uniref:Glutathione synthetase, ATP-grasp domain n=1 Tax=Parapedobacter composti TaxID=623281 RepID=A0A1I1FY95_9SPHI|nr:hypothetical protein [Parapedobacter composti]SFC04241.1 glutathione synthetase, ATP-grasp domain [Parapedobacter composti]
MKIAYIIYQSQERYTIGVSNDEDRELLYFLQGKGLDIVPAIWNDATVDWTVFDAAIIKSPWDYHDHIAAFYQWLDSITHLGIHLLNPVNIVKWNSNKRYLQDIAEAGLPVIPTTYLSKGTTLPVDDTLFETLAALRLVVKPCISAGAKHTFILTPETIGDQAAHINQLLANEGFLAQPFVDEVAQGEWSFLFFGGAYSHCVLKVPKAGDFRVQHQFGGTTVYPEVDPALVMQAHEYVKRFAEGTLYARVDGLMKDGQFYLMELELIEPYLFLNADTARQENYYRAATKMLHAPQPGRQPGSVSNTATMMERTK